MSAREVVQRVGIGERSASVVTARPSTARSRTGPFRRATSSARAVPGSSRRSRPGNARRWRGRHRPASSTSRPCRPPGRAREAPALVVLHPAALPRLRTAPRFPLPGGRRGHHRRRDGVDRPGRRPGRAPPLAAPVDAPELGRNPVPGASVTAAYVEIMRLLIAQRAAK